MQEIGRGEKTFIKIGAFTFEAVQFALKPGADRLSGRVRSKLTLGCGRSVSKAASWMGSGWISRTR